MAQHRCPCNLLMGAWEGYPNVIRLGSRWPGHRRFEAVPLLRDMLGRLWLKLHLRLGLRLWLPQARPCPWLELHPLLRPKLRVRPCMWQQWHRRLCGN